MSHQNLLKHFPSFIDSDAPAAWAVHASCFALAILSVLPEVAKTKSQVAGNGDDHLGGLLRDFFKCEV